MSFFSGDGRNEPSNFKFFPIIIVIKFGNEVILSLIPKQSQTFMSSKGFLNIDCDVYNHCREAKHVITAAHINQVRVKVNEQDKTWEPVDSRIQGTS